MRRFLRNNSLGLVFVALFLITLVGHTAAGYRLHVEEQAQHDEPALSIGGYLRSGEYLESVSENWESEFLQMGMYVLLTVFLIQKNSPESNDPDDPEPTIRWVTEDSAPRLVKLTRSCQWLYDHSLSLAFFALFLASFVIHVLSGAKAASAESISHGGASISSGDYLFSAQLWFESLQNWQSEFLSVAAIVVLAVFLRERNSPESRPVERIADLEARTG